MPQSALFIESEEVLKQLIENKTFSADSKIYCSSPNMLLKGVGNFIEKDWKPEELHSLINSTQEFNEIVYKKFCDSEFKDYALISALVASKMNYYITKARGLEGLTDLHNPKQVTFDYKSDYTNKMINPPISDFLEIDSSNHMKLEIPKSDRKKPVTDHGLLYNFKRLYLGGWETLVCRIAYKFWKVFSWLPSNKEIIVYRENELFFEFAARYIIRGAKLSELKSPRMNQEIKKSLRSEFESIIDKELEDRFSKWLKTTLINKVKDQFYKDLDEQITLYESSKDHWKQELEKFKGKDAILFVNAPAPPHTQSLMRVASEMGIKTLSAQHGITPEINGLHHELYPNYENNYSDFCFTYNQKATEVMSSTPYAKGKCLTVGISARHMKMKTKTPQPLFDLPILYVSTNCYRGRLNWVNATITDFERGRREVELLNNCLSKLPFKILYKTYPMEFPRYPGPDYVNNLAKSFSNIEVFEDKIDNRYLIAQHNFIISYGATSTIGWLLLSCKPLIFIHYKDNMPLRDDAYEAFKNGTFLFEYGDNLAQELIDFFNQGEDEIYRQWHEKSAAHEYLIKNFITISDEGAGKNAYKALRNEVGF